MKHIIGYIVAYFAGATVVRWYLTSEDGKEDLAEILEDAGYEYLATEITGGQPLARKLAAYEQQEREARYEARYVIPERDLELERLLDEEMWEHVEWSYNRTYDTFYSGTEPGLINLMDGTVGTVANYNKDTGYIQLHVDLGQRTERFIDTTISEVYGRHFGSFDLT